MLKHLSAILIFITSSVGLADMIHVECKDTLAMADELDVIGSLSRDCQTSSACRILFSSAPDGQTFILVATNKQAANFLSDLPDPIPKQYFVEVIGKLEDGNLVAHSILKLGSEGR